MTRIARLSLSLALISVLVPAVPAAAAQRATCEVARASRLPAYATQGSWSPDGSRLFLVDPVYEEVLTYAAADGRFLGSLAAPAAVAKQAFFPISTRTFHDQLVIETFPQKLLFMGRRYEVTDIREPLRDLQLAASNHAGLRAKSGKVPGASLESMFMWSFVGDDIVACGDVKQADGTWITGIARFPVAQPDRFQLYAASDFQNPEWTFCRLGFPYIASIADTAYVLLLNDNPGIYEIKPEAPDLRRLEYDLDVPGEVRVPEFTSEAEFVSTMAEVERTTMPVGLYAWDDSLFVLYRRFDSRSGETRWVLDEVDPVTGERRGEPAEIHSAASHLMLIPGERWALVEKGPVIEFHNQRTRQIRMLPSEAIPRPLSGDLCAGE